jgi:glycosyltransferase involved in cell wall biosynthesis
MRSIRRAVFITATESEPRRYGKPVVIGGILDHWCARLGPDNVHLVLIGRPELERPEVAYHRHVIPKPSAVDQLRSVLLHVALAGTARPRRSLQEAAVYAPRIAAALRSLLDQIDPDLELWDTVRMGQYAPEMKRRHRLLYADDLFSERYTTMLKRSDAGVTLENPGGEFQKLLPAPARRVLSSPHVYRPLMRLEGTLVAAAEERQPPWFDATYLIGAEETQRLRARCPGAVIGTLPPLLRAPASLARNYQGDPLFTFIGGFDYAPNIDGISWFLSACREAVLQRLPDARIQVVGTGTERGLPAAAAWGDHVRFLGWVRDLDSALAPSAALLSPLRMGSGVKIKVLEALARGLPVVATPAGVQGIDAGAHSGCLIGNTPAALADAMARLCEPQLNAQLSAAARRTWDTTYSAEVVGRQYDAIFGFGSPDS